MQAYSSPCCLLFLLIRYIFQVLCLIPSMIGSILYLPSNWDMKMNIECKNNLKENADDLNHRQMYVPLPRKSLACINPNSDTNKTCTAFEHSVPKASWFCFLVTTHAVMCNRYVDTPPWYHAESRLWSTLQLERSTCPLTNSEILLSSGKAQNSKWNRKQCTAWAQMTFLGSASAGAIRGHLKTEVLWTWPKLIIHQAITAHMPWDNHQSPAFIADLAMCSCFPV